MEAFSVVITTKNRELFLHRLLESVSRNTLNPSDVIIVNDGGVAPDQKSYEKYGLPLVWIHLQESMGANYARNKGVSETRSDIVFLVDDDDALTEGSFESRCKLMSDDPSLGLCFTGINIVKQRNLGITVRTVYPVSYDNYYYALLKYGNVIGSTSRVALRKRDFVKAGKFDESLSCMQDFDLWIRMAKMTSIKHDGGAGVYYTIHDGNTQVSKNYKRYLDAGRYIYDKYENDLNSFDIKSSFVSSIYCRVAINAAPVNTLDRVKYAVLSLLKKPTFKGFALILPYSALKIFYNI
jgi:glycosyltransferase involved in cell wall biosynthesis